MVVLAASVVSKSGKGEAGTRAVVSYACPDLTGFALLQHWSPGNTWT
jgi:hypothetical protein